MKNLSNKDEMAGVLEGLCDLSGGPDVCKVDRDAAGYFQKNGVFSRVCGEVLTDGKNLFVLSGE